MLNIKSTSLEIDTAAEDIFAAVSNFTHFNGLLPDKVQNFKATEDQCSFEITGMASLAMRIVEKQSPSYVKIVSEAPSPFSFELVFDFVLQESKTLSTVSMQVDVNTIMQMMLKKPLQNFVDMLNTQLKERCEKK